MHTWHARLPPFTTERLTVRAMRPSDVTTFATYRNQPEVARYQDWELPYTPDLAHQLIDEMAGIDGPVPGEWVQLAIDDSTGILVGDLAVYVDADIRTGDHRLHDEPRPPRTRLRHRGRRGAHRPALRPAARAPRRGDARSGERAVGPRARTARLQVRGTRAEGGVRPRRVGRRRPLRDPRRRTSRMARPTHAAAVDGAAGRDHSATTSTAVGRLATHHSQQRFVATMPESYTDALVPEIVDGHPVVPWMRAIEADGELGRLPDARRADRRASRDRTSGGSSSTPAIKDAGSERRALRLVAERLAAEGDSVLDDELGRRARRPGRLLPAAWDSCRPARSTTARSSRRSRSRNSSPASPNPHSPWSGAM